MAHCCVPVNKKCVIIMLDGVREAHGSERWSRTVSRRQGQSHERACPPKPKHATARSSGGSAVDNGGCHGLMITPFDRCWVAAPMGGCRREPRRQRTLLRPPYARALAERAVSDAGGVAGRSLSVLPPPAPVPSRVVRLPLQEGQPRPSSVGGRHHVLDWGRSSARRGQLSRLAPSVRGEGTVC